MSTHIKRNGLSSEPLPARTPGPLGINDAADPNVNAQLGNTPGPWGVNDLSALRANGLIAGEVDWLPARILFSMMMGATPPRSKVALPDNIGIYLVETRPTEIRQPFAILGGGAFFKNADGVDAHEYRKLKRPEVDVVFNETRHLYEIKSIKIYTHIILKHPDYRALPIAGVNITDDETLLHVARHPPDDCEGKGHWEAVIRNMKNYENQNLSTLQWYAPKVNEIHENVHFKQFEKWLKNEKSFFIGKINQLIALDLSTVTTKDLTEERVILAVQNAVIEVTDDADTSNEDEAYRTAFKEAYMPVINEIKKYKWKAN